MADTNTLAGIAQDVQIIQEGESIVLRFVLQSNEGERIPVEMRGKQVLGVLGAGDRVAVKSDQIRGRDGVARPSQVENQTTNSVVHVVRSGWIGSQRPEFWIALSGLAGAILGYTIPRPVGWLNVGIGAVIGVMIGSLLYAALHLMHRNSSGAGNTKKDAPMEKQENQALCVLLTLLTLGIVRFFAVPQGYVRFVTVFGKYVGKRDPGLGRCLAFWGLYQRPSKLVPIREQVREYPSESVFTRDGVNCTIDTVVFFSLKDAFKAIFEVEDYEKAIRSLVQATLRNECGNLAARELLAGRQRLAEQLRLQLDKDTAPWGISVRLVEITDIEMSASSSKTGA